METYPTKLKVNLKFAFVGKDLMCALPDTLMRTFLLKDLGELQSFKGTSRYKVFGDILRRKWREWGKDVEAPADYYNHPLGDNGVLSIDTQGDCPIKCASSVFSTSADKYGRGKPYADRVITFSFKQSLMVFFGVMAMVSLGIMAKLETPGATDLNNAPKVNWDKGNHLDALWGVVTDAALLNPVPQSLSTLPDPNFSLDGVEMFLNVLDQIVLDEVTIDGFNRTINPVIVQANLSQYTEAEIFAFIVDDILPKTWTNSKGEVKAWDSSDGAKTARGNLYDAREAIMDGRIYQGWAGKTDKATQGRARYYLSRRQNPNPDQRYDLLKPEAANKLYPNTTTIIARIRENYTMRLFKSAIAEKGLDVIMDKALRGKLQPLVEGFVENEITDVALRKFVEGQLFDDVKKLWDLGNDAFAKQLNKRREVWQAIYGVQLWDMVDDSIWAVANIKAAVALSAYVARIVRVYDIIAPWAAPLTKIPVIGDGLQVFGRGVGGILSDPNASILRPIAAVVPYYWWSSVVGEHVDAWIRQIGYYLDIKDPGALKGFDKDTISYHTLIQGIATVLAQLSLLALEAHFFGGGLSAVRMVKDIGLVIGEMAWWQFHLAQIGDVTLEQLIEKNIPFKLTDDQITAMKIVFAGGAQLLL